MKTILLYQGISAQVSDEDFENINNSIWHIKVGTRTLYAFDRKHKQWMHRVIMGIEIDSELVVDHIDGNGLNNQRENLRLATHSENMANRNKALNKTSKYLGVCRSKVGWQVSLKNNGKSYTAHFKNETDAAIKYNELAKQYHGKFAKLNDVSEQELIEYKSRLKVKNKDTETHKTCRRCKETKERKNFSEDKNRKDKTNTYCKDCEKLRKKSYN